VAIAGGANDQSENDRSVVLRLARGSLAILLTGDVGPVGQREMLARGDWVTPHFNGQPRFDKPILFYWLILLSYRVFGITEFAVRFWSALAGRSCRAPVAAGARRRIVRPPWGGVAFMPISHRLLARAG
jgi:hypothetical protein